LYNGWAEFVGIFRKCLRISNRPDEAGRAADAGLAILGFTLALDNKEMDQLFPLGRSARRTRTATTSRADFSLDSKSPLP
jgi:hypothetical protein